MPAGSAFFRSTKHLLGALVIVSLSARAPSFSPRHHRQEPPRWEVTIQLKTEGDYKLDEGGPTFVGRYSFSILWTGLLEKEEDDYLLYRLDCRLGDWEAQETASLQETSEFLTAEDFRQRPNFVLNYIIRKGRDLHLDFITDPMSMPQAHPDEARPILLPSSEQNGQREGLIDYNAHVVKGSNQVKIPESAIYAGPVSRTYNWTWKHQQWLTLGTKTAFASQSHEAEVSVSIIPRASPTEARRRLTAHPSKRWPQDDLQGSGYRARGWNLS